MGCALPALRPGLNDATPKQGVAMAKDITGKVRLGRTDLMVTPIGFGAGGLGDMPDTYGYSAGVERAKATVQAILDGPANFIDTSRNYGVGRSEERIGAVLSERGGLPAGFVVSTKLDRDFDDNVFDAARARRSLEQSLEALGLERIDLYTTPSTQVRQAERPRATAREAVSSTSRRRDWQKPWGGRPAARP
jgi:aryl-alcohol dehydrogenase-like predicted oxidoreductase